MLVHIGIDPVLVTIGGLTIHWYGVMVALGLYAGIQVALRDAPRRGIDRDKLLNTSLIAAVLGVLGGRLYYVVQNTPQFYLQHPTQILAVWQGGMAFYGAIFGGGLALLIGCWRYRMNFWSVADLGALGLCIGQVFGRIGNIINGDIVGYPTNGSWGFVYTNPHTFAPRNVAVQPANLYELLIALGLFILLWSVRKRIQPEGMLAMIYVVLYSISQFLIFFLRDNIILFHGLKQAQLTAIVVTIITIPFILYLLRRGQRLERGESEPAPPRTPVGEATG
ncbi:MAG TPA: prolipoprotein diacylglyceryl transferase [Candidatus Limnocylindrales bacterium]|nr:prolipoprotein diacylglyceryl transferase [Candidatus Limnocylindrales bacterium]